MLAPDQKTVSLMSKCNSTVFNYLLTYKGSKSLADEWYDSKVDFGVSHSDDLQYLFKRPPYNAKDKKMINLMVTYWSNFAKYGNPTPFKGEGIANWTPVKPDQKVTFAVVFPLKTILKRFYFQNYLDLQPEPSPTST